MRKKPKTVGNDCDIVFVVSGWDAIEQRPHHFVKEAIAEGYRVCVVTWGKSIRKRFQKDPPYVVRSENFIVGLFTRLFHRFDSKAKSLANRINEMNLVDTLIIYQSPPIIHLADKVFRANKVIYDCMDWWIGFNNTFLYNRMVEEELILKSCRVTCVTDILMNNLKTEYRSSVPMRLLPNACTPSDFREHSPEATNIIYWGTVDKWFDWEKVISLAISDPDVIVKILGVYKVLPEKLPSNVSLLGAIKYDQLSRYAQDCKIGIIPFSNRDHDFLNSISPIKLYEYLACNLIVISSSLPEALTFAQDGIVYIADTKEEFLRQYKEASVTCDSPELRARRKAIISANSWSSRFHEMINLQS
jgi:glycosyltransferase involved in cell wall biosynthesis